MEITNLALGLMLSSAIAVAAYAMHALSLSGALGAVLTGTLIFGVGGWAWGILLIAFFVSSSALSRVRGALKVGLAEKFAKTGRRDLAQALANGGWGAVLAMIAVLAPDRWPIFAAFAGAMAAVNADTWATELGVLSPHAPRLITSGKRVAVGTSGAVSLWGTLAAAGGALFIGVAAGVLSPLEGTLARDQALWLVAAALLGGLAGSLIDSVLGATIQGVYWCDHDQKETEKKIHTCGERTRLLRGWERFDNEWVNFTCSVAGSIVACLVWIIVT